MGPLFGRCPLTNRAFLDLTPPSRKPLKSATSSPYSPNKMSSPYSPAKMSSPYSPYSLYSPSKAFSPSKGNNSYSPYYREERINSPELDLFGRSRLLMDVSSRMPLLQISNNVSNFDHSRGAPLLLANRKNIKTAASPAANNTSSLQPKPL